MPSECNTTRLVPPCLQQICGSGWLRVDLQSNYSAQRYSVQWHNTLKSAKAEFTHALFLERGISVLFHHTVWLIDTLAEKVAVFFLGGFFFFFFFFFLSGSASRQALG